MNTPEIKIHTTKATPHSRPGENTMFACQGYRRMVDVQKLGIRTGTAAMAA